MMKSILPLLLTSALLLAGPDQGAGAAAPPAPAPDFAALDAYVQSQMGKHGLPGVSLAVVQGGQTVYARAYGVTGGRALTPQDTMMIGSTSKSFTALAVAQLADEGLVDLQAPVRRYIPWFAVADEDASARIRVSHLLHHTSGLSEAGFSKVLPLAATPEQAVRALASARVTAPVGTQFQYFNQGYAVLAYLVETVSGQSYADYLRDHIFTPLGMASSSADPRDAGRLSTSYTRLFGFAVPMRQPVRVSDVGAGYIVSTAEDMARYAAAVLSLAQGQSGGLVSPETARLMFTPGLGSYGLGWEITQNGQKIAHGGANETFATDVNLYPARDLAFVLLVNQGHLIDHFVSIEQLSSGVEAALLGENPAPVSQGPSVRWFGWGIGVVFLAVSALEFSNIYRLIRSWRRTFARLSPAKKVLDVFISFLIPTLVLAAVLFGMQSFFGYRFNLITTLAQFRFSLPDIFLLMIVGVLLDYVQGLVKIAWILLGKTRPQAAAAPAPAG